jgi:hypothetical protein
MRGDRREQRRIAQQHVQHRQIVRQDPHFARQQLVPQRLDLSIRQPQHRRPPRSENSPSAGLILLNESDGSVPKTNPGRRPRKPYSLVDDETTSEATTKPDRGSSPRRRPRCVAQLREHRHPRLGGSRWRLGRTDARRPPLYPGQVDIALLQVTLSCALGEEVLIAWLISLSASETGGRWSFRQRGHP